LVGALLKKIPILFFQILTFAKVHGNCPICNKVKVSAKREILTKDNANYHKPILCSQSMEFSALKIEE
jgi:hypothetical protein